MDSNMAALNCQMQRAGMPQAATSVLPLQGQDFRLPIAELFVSSALEPLLFAPPLAKAELNLQPLAVTAAMDNPAVFIIASLPSVYQEFQICDASTASRACLLPGGMGQQTCTKSGNTYYYSTCKAVTCLDGFFLNGQACTQFNMSLIVLQMEAILTSDTPYAKSAREQLATFLEVDTPSSPSVIVRGSSGGAMAGVAIACLIIGAALTLLAIFLYRERGRLFSGGMDGMRRNLSTMNAGAGGNRRGPMDIPMEPQSELAPTAEAGSSFLANLQTRRSRGSMGGDDSDTRGSLRGSKARDPRGAPSHERGGDIMDSPMLPPLAQADDDDV